MAQQSITVRRPDKASRLGWILDGRLLLEMEWDVALDVCNAMRTQIRAARAYASGVTQIVPELTITVGSVALTVRQEWMSILFIGSGRLLFSMFPRDAESFWRANLAQARLAEEWAKAEAVVADAALLFRTGAPFGFTDHPVLQDELVKHAVHDRVLRRALPGGVKSTVILGAPVVILGSPPPAQRLRKLLHDASPAQRLSVRDSLAVVR